MKKISSLAGAGDYYLKARRQLGFASKPEQWALTGLARYAQRCRHRGPLTSSLAIAWARLPTEVGPPQWAVRLGIVRRFARFWQAFDRRTEVPPAGVFGPLQHRRRAHIYTVQEIRALLEATTILGPPHELRAASMKTLLGLLACTGLRVSEALHLHRRDIDWHNRVLTIRHSKSGQARIIPVEPSALVALRA
ncbi:MAG: tyrosine-type recombinase/integrase [Verrucomicrobiota bacterium]